MTEEGYSTPAVVRTVLERTVDPDQAGLGRSVRSVLGAVESWRVSELSTSLVLVSDEFYAADSKLKPGQESPDHVRGELKVPAHEERFWWVRAEHAPLKLALLAGWKEGVTPKGGRSFGFLSAHCADPLGMPAELFTDFSLGALDKKQKKEEPEWAHAERVARMERAARERDYRYNDGQSWLNRRPMFTAFKEFSLWLEEANDMVARAADRKENA